MIGVVLMGLAFPLGALWVKRLDISVATPDDMIAASTRSFRTTAALLVAGMICHFLALRKLRMEKHRMPNKASEPIGASAPKVQR